MIANGTTLGHYRILDRLGEGGMSVVYSAHDTRLDRRVALKFLDPATDTSPERRERFLEEARAASSLDHPNICTIHEIGQTPDGRIFIAMRHYEGTTVREMLKAGSLTPAEARDVVIQTARGLSHAHRLGIVHRDIKPGNLLLTKGGTVKILDFGIAKREGHDLTRTGKSMGTPPYMSPEQVRGDDVDKRTDIWSVGAVLYELLTGERPFEAPRETAVLHRILNTHPSQLAPSKTVIPPHLKRVIRRCLEKSPDARYQSTEELLHELEPPEILPDSRPLRFVRRHPRIMAVFAIALLLSPLLLVTTPGRRLTQTFLTWLVPSAPRNFAVLAFTCSDSADAALAAGLTESLTQVVTEFTSANRALWILPYPNMLAEAVETVAELRDLYPLDLVVTGHFTNGGDGGRLNLDVFDVRPETQTLYTSVEIPRPAESLMGDSAKALVASALGIRGYDRPRRGADQSDHPVPDAQRYYHLGVGQLHRAVSPAGIGTAIELLKTAISVDSTFSLAYSGLCEAYWELYITTQDVTQADSATAVCDRAYELSHSDPAFLGALGKSQAITHQFQAAERTLQEAIDRGAGAEAHMWLGYAFEGQGNLEAAEREYRTAIDLRNDIWVYYEFLGMMYTNAWRHAEALRWHEEVIRTAPDNPRGYNDLGASLMFLDRPDSAEALFRRSIEVRPTFYAHRNLGHLHLRERQYREAVESLEDGLEFIEGDWWSWRWLAHAYHWLGETERERDAWHRTVELIRPALELAPTNRDLLCGLAEATAVLGDPEAAQEHLNFLSSLGITRVYNIFWTGRVFEILGSRRVALQYIHRALEEGFDRKSVANDQWLDDLRADPDYRGPQDGGDSLHPPPSRN